MGRADASSLAEVHLPGHLSTDSYQRFAQDYPKRGKYWTERRMVIVDVDDAEAKAVRLLTRWRDRREELVPARLVPLSSGRCSDGDNAIRAAGVILLPSVVALVVTIATRILERDNTVQEWIFPLLHFRVAAGARLMAPSKMEKVLKMARCARFQVRASDPLPGAPKMSWDIRSHLWDRVAPCWFGGGTSRCTKSRSAHGSTTESTQAIYPGSGRREA